MSSHRSGTTNRWSSDPRRGPPHDASLTTSGRTLPDARTTLATSACPRRERPPRNFSSLEANQDELVESDVVTLACWRRMTGACVMGQRGSYTPAEQQRREWLRLE